MKECGTCHHGCDCREELLRDLFDVASSGQLLVTHLNKKVEDEYCTDMVTKFLEKAERVLKSAQARLGGI